jgi:hypothetical protein
VFFREKKKETPIKTRGGGLAGGKSKEHSVQNAGRGLGGCPPGGEGHAVWTGSGVIRGINRLKEVVNRKGGARIRVNVFIITFKKRSYIMNGGGIRAGGPSLGPELRG